MARLLLVWVAVANAVETRTDLEAAPVIPPCSNWTDVYTYQVDKRLFFGQIKPVPLEIDIDVRAFRQTIAGEVVDLFSAVLSSRFDVEILSGNSVLLNRTSESDSIVSISQVVQLTSADPISIRVRNRNSWFPIKTCLLGEIFTSSEQYDLRSLFPSCPFPVYSQQLCGACYADVVAGAGTDTLCVRNGGNPVVSRLSPQGIISCANLGGCAGGSPYMATLWTQSHGLVDYSSCPFVSGTCDPNHDVDKDGCVSCRKVLPLNIAPSYHFRPVVLRPASEYEIRKRIENHGLVMVIFDAHVNFQEFFQTHPFGIYRSVDATPSLGNHAVRLVGFGVEDNEDKYWIALNSWGTAWANRGSFKILRGINLCMIEQYPVGIESTDLIGGASNGGSNEHYPKVGEYRQQNVRDTYWERVIEKYRDQVSQTLGQSEWEVVSIQTRVSHGYVIKLKFKEPFGATKILIHISPSGQARITRETRSKSTQSPERSLASVL